MYGVAQVSDELLMEVGVTVRKRQRQTQLEKVLTA